MSDTHRLENPAQFFMDSGLLFQINRQVLHPLGLALEVITDDETGEATGFGGVWDYRDEDEGIRFTGEAFNDGLRKWEAFRKEYADEAIIKRKIRLGYVYQEKAK